MPVLLLLIMLCAKSIVGDKGSLGFIIDDSGSMGSDIEQVVKSVDNITDIILTKNTSQVENFILVTFNDPTVRLRAVTKDKYAFKEELNRLILDNFNNGGDCPEKSLTGIEIALRNANPGSYLYVFTDASAKEYNKEIMVKYIQFLAQKKQTQVVFILSPNTYCTNDFDEYYKIAGATSGQVFRLSSTAEVSAVLANVREAVSGKRTLLTSRVFPANIWKDILFTIDDKTEYAVVSCSGEDVQLYLERMDETRFQTYGYDNYNSYENITWINNVKTIKVKTPGHYAIRVKGGGTTSVDVFGRTDFLFEHGFSQFRPHSLNDTAKHPFADTHHYLGIQIENKDSNSNLQVESVEILNMDETLHSRENMILVDNHFYITESLTPPSTMFKLAIDVIDINTGKHIRRISPTPIEPLRLTNIEDMITKKQIAPRVSIESAPRVTVDYRKNLELRCKVYAYPQPHVFWVDKVTGQSFTPNVFIVEYPYDYISILNIPTAKSNTTFSCKAVNGLGEDSKSIEVEITNNVYFNILERPANIFKEYGEDAKVTCKVDAMPPATVTWYRNANLVQNDGNFELSDHNSTLVINYMEKKTEGSYICETRNEFNRKTFYFDVALDAALPKLDGYKTEDIGVANGSDVILNCSVLEGKPKPMLRWFFRKQGTVTEKEMFYYENNEIIYLLNVITNMSGVYRCVATNEMGHDYRLLRLIVGKPPSMKNGNETVNAEDGKEKTLTCDAEGIPPPTMRWMVNGSDVTENKRYRIRNSSMSFTPKVIEDEGNYTCVATNEYGAAERNIELRVFIPVSIEAPQSTNVMLTTGQLLLLPCYADGYPRPTISWIFYKKMAKTVPQFFNFTDDPNYLEIPHVNIDYEGFYTCIATNLGSSASLTYDVSVEAPPFIKNKSSGEPILAVEGDSLLSLPCDAVGSPKPDITWLHDDLPVLDAESYYIDEKGTLNIRNVDEASAGFYTCQAMNKLGSDVAIYEVQVYG